MSSKNAVTNQKNLAYQAEVERKRLGPIYDTIDAGNLKQALKLINTHLKKHPDSQQGKCCKALILEKMGELEEAYAICKEVQAEKPTEPGVLNQLRIVFKSLGKLHDNTILCETALAADPKNKSLAKNLFFSWVKEVDFKNQQQAAMKLWQNFKKNKYFYWSIASNFLQAGGQPVNGEFTERHWPRKGKEETEKEKDSSAPVGLPKQPLDLRLLSLCEAMLNKRFTESPPTHPGILLLYISVLTSQSKYAEALAALSGHHSALFKLPHEKKKYTVNMLCKLEKWEEAHELTKDLLNTHEPDDWLYWMTYLDTLFLLRESEKEKGEEKLKEVYAFLKEIQETRSYCRGPFLAELELEKRLLAEGKDSERYIGLLVNYFSRFNSKLCCYQDMKDLLGPVTKKDTAEQEKFLQTLQSTIAQPDAEVMKGGSGEVRDNYFHSLSSLEGLRRRLGLHARFSREEAIGYINKLWETYIQSTIGLKKEDTENGPGDELAMICGHLLLDLYHKEKNLRYLLDGAIMLEYARVHSKFNFQVKLLLIHFYSLIEALQAALDIYQELEVKHIQMDSLGYLMLDPLIRHALPEKASALCLKIRKFHDARKRDIPEYMIGPYRSENYTKIQEFIEFSSKLERSHQLALTRTEEALLSIQSLTDFASAQKYLTSNQSLVSSSSRPFPYSLLTSAEQLSTLSGNFDKTVMVRWDPPLANEDDVDPFYDAPNHTGVTCAKILGTTEREQFTWLRLRGLVAKLLAAAVPNITVEEEGATPAASSSGGGGGGRGKGGAGAKGGQAAKGGAAAAKGKEKEKEAAPPASEKKEPEKKPLSQLESFKALLEEFSSLLSTVLPGAVVSEVKDANAFDENNWRVIFHYFKATLALLELIQAAEANVPSSEPALEEFKKQATALTAFVNGLAGYVNDNYYHHTAEGEKAFNIFAVTTLNAFSIETLGWFLVLLLNWAMAMPSKKRKGPISKVFQQARAQVKELVDTVAGFYATLHPLLKEQTDLSLHKSSLPFGVTSPFEFVGHCQDEKLKGVVVDVMNKIKGSHIVSLQNMADSVEKKQQLAKLIKPLL